MIKEEDYLLSIQTLFPKDLKLLEEVKVKVQNRQFTNLIKNRLKEREVSSFSKKELKETKNILKKNSIKFITLLSEDYPENLKKSYAPPLALFYKGDISLLKKPLISMVGTRKPTTYGIKQALYFSEKLANAGLVIVSGMAKGIDSYAHKGALKKGETVAVLGNNLLKIYPVSNKKLFHEIVEKGCAISEFAPDYPTHPSNFPIRNRVIAALSFFTLVIEAKEKSGSLITAMIANEEGREVGAIPGNIDSSNSKGTNNLIKNGAMLIYSPEDILELHYYQDLKDKKREEEIELSEKEIKILEIIPKDKLININEIIEKSSLNFGELFNILLQLRFKNLIIEFTGKNYQRIK